MINDGVNLEWVQSHDHGLNILVAWNASVMLLTLTMTPCSVECKNVNAGSHTLLKVESVRETSRTTSGDPADCVHTTEEFAPLMAHSRRARD